MDQPIETQIQDGDLQDLSANDADELNAFLAKRKWFEVKLKELEEQKRIYPFVQLSGEVDESKDIPTSLANQTLYELPTRAQLVMWQKERDAIEEEVVIFDGGDLERMKQKTRAVTVVPLTDPSTELVAVTLDLIVVVDRLLTLLRHRSEVLDLTLLRHQWDELRRKCIGEMSSMETEIAAIYKGTLEWISNGCNRSATPRILSIQLDGESKTDHRSPATIPLTPERRPDETAASSSSPSRSALHLPLLSIQLDGESKINHRSPATIPLTPDRRPDGAAASSSSPSRSTLHLPLLRSKITNLQIRQSTLVTTMIPHAGTGLDKMIDIAGSLQGLGGVNGPNMDGEENGAVPEELLDAQDVLEVRSSRSAQEITSLRQVLEQLAAAERHHASSVRCQQAALQLLARMSSDVDLDLSHIRSELVDASKMLPAPYVWTIPSLQGHLHYSDEVVGHLLRRLEDAHNEAKATLKQCEIMNHWLERLVEQREIVQGCIGEYRARSAKVSSLLKRIDDVIDGSFSVDTSNEHVEAILRDIQAWDKDLSELDAQSSLQQRATIINMRYRAILRHIPPGSTPTIAEDDDLLPELDGLYESTARLTMQLRDSWDRLTRDGRLRSLITHFIGTAAGERVKLDDSSEALQTRIDAALWSQVGSDTLPTSDTTDRVEDETHDIAIDITGLCSEIEHIAGSDRRFASAIQMCRSTTETIEAKVNKRRRLRLLLARAIAQTGVVNEVRTEAASLLERIILARAATFSIEKEVVGWLDTLASRITYISAPLDAIDRPVNSQLVLSPGAAAPLTPPASPSATEELSRDLSAVDRLVRNEVNAQAAKVRGALTHAISLATRPVDPPPLPDSTASESDPNPIDPFLVSGASGHLAVPTSAVPSFSTSSTSSCPTSRKAALSALGNSVSSQTSLASSSSIADIRAAPTTSSAERSRLGRSSASAGSSLRNFSTPTTGTAAKARASGSVVGRSSPKSASSSWSAVTTPAPGRAVHPSSRARQSVTSIPWRSPANQTTPTRVIRKYVPDSTNKLDVAVGEIVNDFKTHVPIVPIGANASDEYKDMTGSYWIGAEGRAKLCFCRILRSKMVMVRVGGGWVELSKFLADHFTDSALQVSPRSPLTTSALLQSSSDPDTTTPVRMRVSSAPTAGSKSAAECSPVFEAQGETENARTPMRFMKKASDSPDARLKEKAALKVGRRSILGKETNSTT